MPTSTRTTPLVASSFERRFLRTADPCSGCGFCNGKLCEPARSTDLRDYGGIRFTSDGFDCALPVSIDSHTHCAYGCLYCFSDNLVAHREGAGKPLGQTSLRKLESIFAGEGGKDGELFREALKYDRPNLDGYPCPVQLGAINDPCDHIERQQGWLLKFIEIAIRYKQPVRISTKGTVFQLPEYQEAIAKAPHLFWVTFSIISPDDELVAKIDRRAPSPTERLKTMAILSKLGVTTSLRMRPMLPGVSDRTPRYDKAYLTLIERAREAGACAISYEVAFTPGAPAKGVRERWERLEHLTHVPMLSLYKKFGPNQACTRPAHAWTEEIMHRVAEAAHGHGMTVGVSDPVWKQLNDCGCCCGILPDNRVFGNWQRENATNALVMARDGRIDEIGPEHVIPSWAPDTPLRKLVAAPAGPKGKLVDRQTWADAIREQWNDLNSQRGPLTYFQGALRPVRRDKDGNVYYRFEGLRRENLAKVPYWRP